MLINFSYVFRCHIGHHQRELLCLLLKTRYCNEDTNYGFCCNRVVNHKKVQLCVYWGYNNIQTATEWKLYCH